MLSIIDSKIIEAVTEDGDCLTCNEVYETVKVKWITYTAAGECDPWSFSRGYISNRLMALARKNLLRRFPGGENGSYLYTIPG